MFSKVGFVNVGSGTSKLFFNKLKIVPSSTSLALIMTSSIFSPSVKQASKSLRNLLSNELFFTFCEFVTAPWQLFLYKKLILTYKVSKLASTGINKFFLIYTIFPYHELLFDIHKLFLLHKL